MAWQGVRLTTGAAVLAAFVLAVPSLLAGDRVHAGNQTVPRSQTVAYSSPRVASAPVTIAVVVAEPAAAANEETYINLRGPDGQMRRFAVEGGREALSSRVVVLRPGESLTIRLTANK
jgi:hypothetical protein